jgi:hypothetical protein
MSKKSSRFRLTAVALSVVGLGCPVVSSASAILPGFDIFETLPGAYVDLECEDTSILQVPLEGNPVLLASEGIGPTDTIVERLQGIDPFEAPLGTGVVNIELVALSLKSTVSFNAGCLSGVSDPTMVDLYVTVNTDLVERPDLPVPDAPLPASTGTMTIHHINPDGTLLQGTFISTLNVFADLIFVVPGGDVNNLSDVLFSVPELAPLVLNSTGQWTHTAWDPDHHNAQYPAGDFYIPPGEGPGGACEGPCIEHTGPHPVITTPVTLIDNSFTATASNGAVTIAWETAMEIDNAGFYVWRGQLKADKTECSKNGKDYTKVKRLNSTLVPAEGDASSYSYEDWKVASGNTYCYALEDVDLFGKSTYHLDDIPSATVP